MAFQRGLEEQPPPCGKGQAAWEQQMFVASSPFAQLSLCMAGAASTWGGGQRNRESPDPPCLRQVRWALTRGRKKGRKEESCSRLGKFYRGVLKTEHSGEKENIAIKVDSANIFLHSCCCD